MHKQSLDKIRIIEAPKEAAPTPEPPTFQKPVFTQPLQNVDQHPEGQPVRLEARMIPVNDPKLRLEWYFNNQPLAQSNRIMYSQDFGFVSLDIAGATDNDNGVYMCRAVNDLGEAVTTASVQVLSNENKLSLLYINLN